MVKGGPGHPWHLMPALKPFPPPGDLPDPGIKLWSCALAGRFFTAEPPGKPAFWCERDQDYIWLRTLREKGDTAKQLAEKIHTEKKSSWRWFVQEEIVLLWRKEPSTGVGPRDNNYRGSISEHLDTVGPRASAHHAGYTSHRSSPRQGDALPSWNPFVQTASSSKCPKESLDSFQATLWDFFFFFPDWQITSESRATRGK